MSRRHWCLAAVLIGSASATLMQNFITVSLPTIASELAGHSTVGWVVGAYMLASTAVLLNSGRWADRQGPRKVYVVGTLLYAVATVLTSQSQSMVQLIMFRVIQGLGAGIIVPASMAAVTRYWRDKRLGRIIGLLGSMQVVATLIGAPLGGWLTSVLGWRVAFASPALLSIVALTLSLSLPGSRLPSEPDKARSLRSVLAEPVFVRGLISTAGLSSLAYGAAAYLPMSMAHTLQMDAATLGWLVLPLVAGSGIGSAIGGLRAHHERTEVIGWLTATIGVLTCLVPHIWSLAVGGALVGIGVGIGMPAIFVRLQDAIGGGSEAVTSGFVQFARNAGGALGVPLYGVGLMLPVVLSTSLLLTFSFMSVVAIGGLILCWAGIIGVSSYNPVHKPLRDDKTIG